MEQPFYLSPEWQPPFCPNPKCSFHRHSRRSWRFKRIGSYSRQAPPKRVPRWICLHCGRSFSGQTFHSSYWQKRPGLVERAFMKAVGGMANRQIARDLQVAPSTIDHQLRRLGRHCLLFHHLQWQRTRLSGPLVIDSFESFELSQFYPFQHHVAAERDSGFMVWFTDSPLRRKGRMTEVQKKRRERLETRLGRPDPQAVRKDTSELLRVCLRDLEEATVLSDDHKAYPIALREQHCRIEHRVTSGKERRDAKNPLFEINLLDGLIRHSQAGHRRETWAAPKRRQGSAERLAIFLVWRNYIKWRWENRCRQTPAMIKGLFEKRLGVGEIFRERLFRTKTNLSGRWGEYYDRLVNTPALGVNLSHDLTYAY